MGTTDAEIKVHSGENPELSTPITWRRSESKVHSGDNPELSTPITWSRSENNLLCFVCSRNCARLIFWFMNTFSAPPPPHVFNQKVIRSLNHDTKELLAHWILLQKSYMHTESHYKKLYEIEWHYRGKKSYMDTESHHKTLQTRWLTSKKKMHTESHDKKVTCTPNHMIRLIASRPEVTSEADWTSKAKELFFFNLRYDIPKDSKRF